MPKGTLTLGGEPRIIARDPVSATRSSVKKSDSTKTSIRHYLTPNSILGFKRDFDSPGKFFTVEAEIACNQIAENDITHDYCSGLKKEISSEFDYEKHRAPINGEEDALIDQSTEEFYRDFQTQLDSALNLTQESPKIINKLLAIAADHAQAVLNDSSPKNIDAILDAAELPVTGKTLHSLDWSFWFIEEVLFSDEIRPLVPKNMHPNIYHWIGTRPEPAQILSFIAIERFNLLAAVCGHLIPNESIGDIRIKVNKSLESDVIIGKKEELSNAAILLAFFNATGSFINQIRGEDKKYNIDFNIDVSQVNLIRSAKNELKKIAKEEALERSSQGRTYAETLSKLVTGDDQRKLVLSLKNNLPVKAHYFEALNKLLLSYIDNAVLEVMEQDPSKDSPWPGSFFVDQDWNEECMHLNIGKIDESTSLKDIIIIDRIKTLFSETLSEIGLNFKEPTISIHAEHYQTGENSWVEDAEHYLIFSDYFDGFPKPAKNEFVISTFKLKVKE